MRRHLWIPRLLAAGLAVALVGCKSDSERRDKPSSAKGRVTYINLDANKVKMITTLEKTGKESEVEASIRSDTEVWVNGVKKGLSDVAVDDEVTVEYTRSGEGPNREFVVLKVDVTRSAQGPQWQRFNQPNMPTTAVSEALATTRPKMTLDTPTPGATMDTSTPHTAASMSHTPKATHTPTTAPATAPADPESQRIQKTVEIYTLIRQRMNEALAARAELLKAGKSGSDPEVAKHENVIRNARRLLMEIGENVDPVDPPLTEPTVTTTQPAKP